MLIWCCLCPGLFLGNLVVHVESESNALEETPKLYNDIGHVKVEVSEV